ncbi:sensor histidine kinase [Rummeliibacillus pycnus]|uniref:sensor histidine kinase n=1 Tax=Rummeliibacillus pycnus TaxID=101070 RepID=UPI000C9C52D0|nr:HAMP domain-containing sensor histidine kinase [Rummeliibacillus pycnus]
MKINTKINLITTIWIICVLVIVNIVVFYSFMTVTVNVEKKVVLQNASAILEDINHGDTDAVIEKKLSKYLTHGSFIRILDDHSKIIHQVTNNKELANKIKARFSRKTISDRYLVHLAQREEQILVVRIPIESNGKVIETLEIGERLVGLELGKDVLLSILIFCTIMGALISLIGGKWLSNIIIRPVSNMIDTMEEIEQSGITKRMVIDQQPKDELQKMAVTFNRMMDRLDINIEKQQQFISDASHELKTPITVIKSYADFLRRRGIQNKEVALDAVEVIHSEATRIQQMTERFLDLANTDLENELEKKSIDLVALCKEIVKQLHSTYKRDLLLHYKEKTITVIADELKLKQVIIILLDNAIKYSSDQIDIYLENQKNGTIIRVKDYGIGIPKEEINNVFERFYRVDKARNRETGGTGLGLSIAKNIMKQHNGEIKVNSTEGVGTEVELFLPKD